MQVTVFGASGKVGRLVVQRLLDDGYAVVAFVHKTTPVAHSKLKTVTGDVHDAKAVSQAVQGSDIVISTLGSWGTKSKDILSSAMRTIIPAMQSAGIKRIVTVTGSGAYAPGDTPSIIDIVGHFTFGIIAKKIITDSEAHLQLLHDSGLDWTVIRSPVMTGSNRTGYTLTSTAPLPWEVVSRFAVAKAIVDQVSAHPKSLAAPFIHRG